MSQYIFMSSCRNLLTGGVKLERSLVEIREEEVDEVIGEACSELDAITDKLSQQPTEDMGKQFESVILANVQMVSLTINQFVTPMIKKGAGWIRKRIERWLRKYIPLLKKAMAALAKALKADSFSIEVGFPFSVSAGLSFKP